MVVVVVVAAVVVVLVAAVADVVKAKRRALLNYSRKPGCLAYSLAVEENKRRLQCRLPVYPCSVGVSPRSPGPRCAVCHNAVYRS